jgi:hypothetical protein
MPFSPDTRIVISNQRFASDQDFADMEDWLSMFLGQDQYSSKLLENDYGDWIGVLFRIACRDTALRFRDIFQ